MHRGRQVFLLTRPSCQSLYVFVALFTIIGINCTAAATHCAAAGARFSYFTVLTYWGLGFYFLAAAIHTLAYALTGASPLARLPRLLQAAHVALRTTIVVFPFVVTLVYWSLIYNRAVGFPTAFVRWTNVSEHGLNSLFALVEILVSRAASPPSLHQLWLLVVLALYLALAYVTRAVQGVYVYTFLDPARHRHGLVAAYVFGIAVAALLLFWFSWAAHWARRRLTEDCWHWRGKSSPYDRRNGAAGDGERALVPAGSPPGRGLDMPSWQEEAEMEVKMQRLPPV